MAGMLSRRSETAKPRPEGGASWRRHADLAKLQGTPDVTSSFGTLMLLRGDSCEHDGSCLQPLPVSAWRGLCQAGGPVPGWRGRRRAGIIGGNGAGKTTLFRMMLGSQQADGGSITLGETVVPMYVEQERGDLASHKRALHSLHLGTTSPHCRVEDGCSSALRESAAALPT